MFYWRATVSDGREGTPRVEAAFTSREPRHGAPPYVGLNLGGHVGDDPTRVEANRELLAEAMEVPRDRLLFLRQVHGTEVVEAVGPWPTEAPEADGVVSRATGLALAVLVADCVPVLLHDAQAGVIGAVHAGRPGMLGGVVPRALDAMRRLGAQDVSAVVGPSVCGRCYEVPADMADGAARTVGSSAARSWTGTPAIDVAAGVVEQLAASEVAVTWVPGCTREHEELYSYRRDGQTGRFAGVIVLRGAQGV